MMKPEHLLQAIGEVNDEVIRDARFGQPVGKRIGLRRIVTVALAAVLMLAMSITAVGYFSGAEWFERYFSWGKELSQQQSEFVTNAMIDIDQSVTVDGWTITADRAMSDGSAAFISLTLTAPEDVDLTAVNYSVRDFYLRNDDSGVKRMTGSRIFFQQDPVNAVNISAFSLQIYNNSDYASFSLSDGSACVLTIERLELQDPNTYETLKVIDGPWEFRFTFSENMGAIELVEEPVICSSGGVEITSCQLSALGLWIRFSADSDEARENIFGYSGYDKRGYQPPTVVMKDGACYTAIGQGGGYTTSENYMGGSFSYKFATPILLENADCLLLNDGTKIDIH